MESGKWKVKEWKVKEWKVRKFEKELLYKLSNFLLYKLLTHLILEATHREPVRSVAAEHVGIAAAEVEAAGAGGINRTAPIEAVGPHSVERTIAVAAAARHGQFQRRSKSTGTVILAPTQAFCV